MEEQKDKQDYKIHIAVENFGPIEKAEIDLRPLTIFVGESNTGKTYLASLIYALFRYFEGINQFPWSYHISPSIAFTYRRRNLPIDNQAELDQEIGETLEKLNRNNCPFRFSDLPDRIRLRLESKLNRSELITEELQRCLELESFANLIRLSGGLFNQLKVSLHVWEQKQKLWHFEMLHYGPSSNAEGSVNGDIILRSDVNPVPESPYDFDDLLSLLRKGRFNAPNTYYLPAARSGIINSQGLIVSSVIDRVAQIGYKNLPRISAFSGMTADFIKLIIEYGEKNKSLPEIEEIATVLEEEVLYGKIKVQRHGTTEHPQFYYHPRKAGIRLGMNSSSSMVSELAPLIMLLRGIVKPGDTLIIEEPEAHLHPRAQTKIAMTLARLVRAGVRVIITTHSDWLLEQIGNLVREGEVMKLDENYIEPPSTWLMEEDVGAWRFHTDKPVEEINFDLISGFEPHDYGEVAEELYNRSVDLRTLLMKKMGDNKVE